MNIDNINKALNQYEATEANLVKLEKLWNEIASMIPEDIIYTNDESEYEEKVRSFELILDHLPNINGWQPAITIYSLNEIANFRMDAKEIDEIRSSVAIEQEIFSAGNILKEYRFKLNLERRKLIRNYITKLSSSIDKCLSKLVDDLPKPLKGLDKIEHPEFEKLKGFFAQIDVLLGSSITRSRKWADLRRHLRFGEYHDLADIIELDWSIVKSELETLLFDETEPIPIDVDDLSSLSENKLSGTVSTKLNWEKLTPENFERLIYLLIKGEKGYENVDLSMQTNAPDRGRDISAYRVYNDPLGGTIRNRVIIQCKHWLSKSISVSDLATLKEQMKLWEPPRIDVHVIAASGRFTTDAVTYMEKHNQSDSALRIEFWPESHLESLLAKRPELIAEFKLR